MTISPPVTAGPSTRGTSSPRTVLAVASLGGFMAFVDATVVNVAFPDILGSFPDSTISSLSWILNAYNIVFAAALVAAGRFADLLGRRRVYLAGLAVFTVASALCAAAPSVGVLIGMRVAQALGAALLVPSSLALVLQAHPAGLRHRAVATVAAVSALAAGIGPALGGLLVEVGSWRLVFLVNVPVGVVGYLLARHTLDESRQAGRRRMPDLLGALLFALAIATLVLAVVQAQDWGSAPTAGCVAVAGILGGLFLRRCRRHRSPLLDLALLRHRTFAAANAASVVAAAGFFGYTLINVLFLTEVWGYPVLEAGLAITPGPLVAIAVARPAGRVADRYGHRIVLVTGGLLWGGAVLWFVDRVGPVPDYAAEWLPGMVLLGLGAGVLFPGLSAVAVASAPGDGFATATGLNTVARQVGAAFGVATVVAIVQGTDPREPALVLRAFDDAWTFSAVCLTAAGVACLLVARTRVEPVDAVPSGAVPSGAGLRDEETVHVPVEHIQRSGTVRTPSGPPPRRPSPRPVDPDLTERVDRPLRESPADFLGRVSIFATLGAETRHAIAGRSRVLRVGAGRWLFRTGDAGDALFVVRSGRLEVVDEPTARVLRVLGRGDVVGELAVLAAQPRSVSVRAARHSEVIAVPGAEIEQLLATRTDVSAAMTRMLAGKLLGDSTTRRDVRPVPSTIAIVALDQRVPVAELAHRLAAELRRWGTVDRLDARDIVIPLGEEAALFSPMLDRALARHDRVVLVAGPGRCAGPWTDFCLQQADRVLVVGSPSTGPAAAHAAQLRGCDLVAWDVRPGSGSLGSWASALQPVETHVVRPTSITVDVARMARRLAGRSIGVVLSGGGARALAHVGVLSQLQAAGVVIDRVGGVSMGAFVGALFAMGLDADEIDARCFDEWVRRRPLRDLTVPRHALIRGDRCRAMLRRTFGGVAIEEVPRGLFTAATDLRSAELVVSRWGPLGDAVGSSMAIPVLAPPVIRDRRILVDGSLLDNLPVATMAALGEGPIIAVDCTATPDSPTAGPPSLGEMAARVLLLGRADTAERARRYADWTITPRDPGIGLLEFSQIDAAREAGHDAVRRALDTAPPHILGGRS